MIVAYASLAPVTSPERLTRHADCMVGLCLGGGDGEGFLGPDDRVLEAIELLHCDRQAAAHRGIVGTVRLGLSASVLR